MNNETLSGLTSLVLGLGYLIYTFLLPQIPLTDPVGPYIFPIIISSGAILCGIILIIIGQREQKEKDKITILKFGNKVQLIKISIVLLCGVIYGLLINYLGYLLATFIFMFLITVTMNGAKKLLESFILSLVFSVTTYVLFAIIFNLSLPMGLLNF